MVNAAGLTVLTAVGMSCWCQVGTDPHFQGGTAGRWDFAEHLQLFQWLHFRCLLALLQLSHSMMAPQVFQGKPPQSLQDWDNC